MNFIFRTISELFQDNLFLRINDLYLIGGSVDSSSEQFSTEIVGGQSIECVVDATYKFLNGCFFFLFVVASEVVVIEAVSSSTFNELGGESAEPGLPV